LFGQGFRMRHYFSLTIALFCFFAVHSQDSIPFQRLKDTTTFSDKARAQQERREAKLTTIKDYKVINFQRDTTFVDTTLTLQKEYKYNFLRIDDFELMPFSNIGQPYNRLAVALEENTYLPKLGASAKQFSYFELEDIPYYNVPTPLTELFFKTTLEQGQLLDAMLTFNTSRRLNFHIAYRGFRSLGKYQFDQAESGSFRTSFNYRTANNRYWVRGHYAYHDAETEENGGLSSKVLQFESGDENFEDRSRLDVAYTNADNRVLGRRYFLDHQFNLVRPRKDSIKTRSTLVSIGHRFSYESQFYQFLQTAENDAFGSSFLSEINDKASLKTTYNQVSANFSNKTLGSLSGNINLYNYTYFFNSILVDDVGEIPNQLQFEEIALGADYKNQIGKIAIQGKVRYALSGEVAGNLLKARATYVHNEQNRFFAGIEGTSRAPNFNFLLYQSDYIDFNWQNPSFEKQQVQTLYAGFESRLLGNLNASYTAMDNYTYFGLDQDAVASAEAELMDDETIDGRLTSFVRPFQETNTINYLKVKYAKEVKWRKWALQNTVMYQNVMQENEVLNLPQLVTRNTLYFSSDVFKKAMFLQTGVTFKYFSGHYMNGYHPLLGEFYVQNREKLGAYPLIDVFVNAKVRQTRIYFKAEHLNTVWTKQYNYYSAPNYPYRDFVIRFGLVWNFFS